MGLGLEIKTWGVEWGRNHKGDGEVRAAHI